MWDLTSLAQFDWERNTKFNTHVDMNVQTLMSARCNLVGGWALSRRVT